ADYSGVPRVSRLDRALYACDELSGFVHAVALVRPGRAIAGLEPPSVRKKLKDKGFARTVNRDDVYRGAAELGVDLGAHIAFVIPAPTEVAPKRALARPKPDGEEPSAPRSWRPTPNPDEPIARRRRAERSRTSTWTRSMRRSSSATAPSSAAA